MFNDYKARKKMFQDMGEFASQERGNELKTKYGPKEEETEVEPVPGTEETEGAPVDDVASGEPQEGGKGEATPEIEALLSRLTPEQLQALLELV